MTEFVPIDGEHCVNERNNKTTRFFRYFSLSDFRNKKKAWEKKNIVVNNFAVDAINNLLFVFC